MTYANGPYGQPDQTMHYGMPPGPSHQRPPARGGRRIVVGLTAFATLVAAVTTGVYLATRPESSQAAAANGANKVVTTSSPSPNPSLTLSPENFDLKVKILEKQCFGEAGCNVTYQIKVTGYDGPEDLGDQRFRVVYEVRGGEDGPQVNNLIFEGDSYQYDQEETISTRPHPHLTAKVTDVIEEDASS
jgi:hypothetical protein